MSSVRFSERAPPLLVVPPHRTVSFRNRLRGAGTVARRAWRARYVRRLGFRELQYG